eukprot:TRINITY_DN7835_c0_g1_i1.p1 TRINITY_DN7835_c0_g1~~TRINITY_DN7835_c0_g1_i1.p1  ORF type:complete len:588 (+),score=100.57 TRINITY_DN7835_c0_g1_i1:213-1976(+)
MASGSQNDATSRVLTIERLSESAQADTLVGWEREGSHVDQRLLEAPSVSRLSGDAGVYGSGDANGAAIENGNGEGDEKETWNGNGVKDWKENKNGFVDGNEDGSGNGNWDRNRNADEDGFVEENKNGDENGGGNESAGRNVNGNEGGNEAGSENGDESGNGIGDRGWDENEDGTDNENECVSEWKATEDEVEACQGMEMLFAMGRGSGDFAREEAEGHQSSSDSASVGRVALSHREESREVRIPDGRADLAEVDSRSEPLHDELAQLRHVLACRDGALWQLQGDFAALKEECDGRGVELASAKSELLSKEDQFRVMQAAFDEATSATQLSKNELIECQAALEEAVGEKGCYYDALVTVKEANEELTEAFSALQMKVVGIEQDISLKRELGRKRKAAASVSGSSATSSTQGREQACARERQALAEADFLREEVEQLQTEITCFRVQNELLEQKVAELEECLRVSQHETEGGQEKDARGPYTLDLVPRGNSDAPYTQATGEEALRECERIHDNEISRSEPAAYGQLDKVARADPASMMASEDSLKQKIAHLELQNCQMGLELSNLQDEIHEYRRQQEEAKREWDRLVAT